MVLKSWWSKSKFFCRISINFDRLQVWIFVTVYTHACPSSQHAILHCSYSLIKPKGPKHYVCSPHPQALRSDNRLVNPNFRISSTRHPVLPLLLNSLDPQICSTTTKSITIIAPLLHPVDATTDTSLTHSSKLIEDRVFNFVRS